MTLPPIIVASLLALAPAAALAQVAAPPGPTIPEKDLTRPQDQPGNPANPAGAEGGSLSRKLQTTGGVIAPSADVDPDMTKRAPDTGAMPVIPPPGSPGGDPSVQPK